MFNNIKKQDKRNMSGDPIRTAMYSTDSDFEIPKYLEYFYGSGMIDHINNRTGGVLTYKFSISREGLINNVKKHPTGEAVDVRTLGVFIIDPNVNWVKNTTQSTLSFVDSIIYVKDKIKDDAIFMAISQNSRDPSIDVINPDFLINSTFVDANEYTNTTVTLRIGSAINPQRRRRLQADGDDEEEEEEKKMDVDFRPEPEYALSKILDALSKNLGEDVTELQREVYDALLLDVDDVYTRLTQGKTLIIHKDEQTRAKHAELL